MDWGIGAVVDGGKSKAPASPALPLGVLEPEAVKALYLVYCQINAGRGFGSTNARRPVPSSPQHAC